MLSGQAQRLGKSHRAKIYPDHGTTPKEGHGGFCMDPGVWGDDVLEFLSANGVR